MSPVSPPHGNVSHDQRAVQSPEVSTGAGVLPALWLSSNLTFFTIFSPPLEAPSLIYSSLSSVFCSLSWFLSLPLFFVTLTLINGLIDSFVAFPLVWVCLTFFHDWSKLFIYGTITAELMLFPSLYLITKDQSVVVIILTAAEASLIPWLRWCLWVPHLEHDCHPFVVNKYPEDALNLCRPCFAAATLPSGIHQLICLPVISVALARCWSSLPVPVVVTGLPPEGRAIPSPRVFTPSSPVSVTYGRSFILRVQIQDLRYSAAPVASVSAAGSCSG